MNFFCKLLGHTWIYQTENPKVSWNTGKSLSELYMTTDGEPRFWLECRRCGVRNESPSRDEIKRVTS